MILFISSAQILFILFVTLLFFGSKKIPEIARAIGKGVREFQKATEELKREISKESTMSDEVTVNKSSKNESGGDSSNKTDNQQKTV